MNLQPLEEYSTINLVLFVHLQTEHAFCHAAKLTVDTIIKEQKFRQDPCLLQTFGVTVYPNCTNQKQKLLFITDPLLFLTIHSNDLMRQLNSCLILFTLPSIYPVSVKASKRFFLVFFLCRKFQLSLSALEYRASLSFHLINTCSLLKCLIHRINSILQCLFFYYFLKLSSFLVHFLDFRRQCEVGFQCHH